MTETTTKEKRGKPGLLSGLRGKLTKATTLGPPYAILLLLAFIGLLLLGPLRGFVLSTSGHLAFAASLVLFITPGALLSYVLPSRFFSGAARLPVAFVLSAGAYGLLAVPVLLLHGSPEAHLWICGGIVAGSMVLAVIILVGWRGTPKDASSRTSKPINLLWAPLVLLGMALAFTSKGTVSWPLWDQWYYVAYVGEFLNTSQLGLYDPFFGTPEVGTVSRMVINGWLLEQSALSWVSGIDHVELMLGYLAPTLVVVALLTFYALALILFENKSAALLTSSLTALYFLVCLDPLYETFGGSLVAYITQDKYLAQFVFLPMALGFAVVFLKERKLRYLTLFAFTCWSVVAVHPLALVVVGISTTGFGLVHLAINRRDRKAWISLAGLAAAMLSIGLPPAAYLLATGSPLLSKLSSTEPAMAAHILYVVQANKSLLALGENSFMMHPSLLLEPAVLGAYLLGIPFLLRHLKRSIAAQMLLGILLFVPVLIYVPPVATFIGKFIGPWMLPRLSWPIPLAAFLTLGWITWELLDYVRAHSSRFRIPDRALPFLPLIFVSVLTIGAAPLALDGIRAADASGETPQRESSCLDPAFRWMQGVVTSPSLVLAPTAESSCITAYVAPANVMQLRTVTDQAYQPTLGQSSSEESETPQSVSDAQRFVNSSVLDEEMVQILQRNGVGYVLLPTNSPLDEQLAHVPGFSPTNTPGDRYRLYEVNQGELKVTPTVKANSYLNQGEWNAAIEAYEAALRGDKDEQLLAYLGVGRAYTELQRYADAAESYDQAVRLAPDDPALHSLLAESYVAAGDEASARAALEQAPLLAPRDVDLRSELGALLLEMGYEQEAIDQYRKVVEMFQEVPEYRVQLGEALNRAGDFEAADEEFARAIRLNPRSAALYVLLGNANAKTERPKEAAAYYERASEIDSNLQLSYPLGRAYSEISMLEKDETYFDMAEEELSKAAELESRTPDERLKAHLALGKLYRKWKQPEKAVAAYEEALKIDPGSEPAREGLERLREK